MLILVNTTIDCKACLDSVLLYLLLKTSYVGYRESGEGYEILMSTKSNLHNIRNHVMSVPEISFEIVSEKELTEVEYSELEPKFTMYTQSFWE